MTEKNGQPSMEEILASIRRIIAEEPTTHPHNGEFRGTPIVLKGDGALEDASEFDLPSIFRSSPPSTNERQIPLLGRLTDAIRHATSSVQPEAAVNGEAHAAEASASSGSGTPSPSAGLSTLKSVRPDLHTAAAPSEPGRPAGSAPANGASVANTPSQPASQQSGPFPAAASGGLEPHRVMAPFKDTHFLRMSGPTVEPSPQPTAAPAPVPAAPPVQYAAPDFSGIISEVPEQHAPVFTPPPAAVPQEPIAMPPPPPLPPVAAAHPQPAPVAAPPAPTGEPTGTIEDATADLLRPMLRQWLADNMPRMVEKALHIEMAESIKAPRKP
ncbi:DUF2497 domain-containing protein [Hyphomicrobium sp. CS1GBMeth3]|uniref:DUF2497 domain-containing protein n=1 Tax=Hyphomicrobium sp. CS1GBMeth3 TaxID=1892845 RepID=UPI0015592DCC|nr:DUF2497 domain-containing protein [Hyphomicrobium sp. CS1GBMeth3]